MQGQELIDETYQKIVKLDRKRTELNQQIDDLYHLLSPANTLRVIKKDHLDMPDYLIVCCHNSLIDEEYSENIALFLNFDFDEMMAKAREFPDFREKYIGNKIAFLTEESANKMFEWMNCHIIAQKLAGKL